MAASGAVMFQIFEVMRYLISSVIATLSYYTLSDFHHQEELLENVGNSQLMTSAFHSTLFVASISWYDR